MSDFEGTIREPWEACGDTESWKCELTDRLAKRLSWLASESPEGWSQSQFEAAMINYSRRATLLQLEDSE